MNKRDNAPWLLSLEMLNQEQAHEAHLFPIRNDDLDEAREFVEFLQNCWRQDFKGK